MDELRVTWDAELSGRLLALLRQETRRYTSGESSSVPWETAQSLLASLLYTLRLNGEAPGERGRQLAESDLAEELRRGQTRRRRGRGCARPAAALRLSALGRDVRARAGGPEERRAFALRMELLTEGETEAALRRWAEGLGEALGLPEGRDRRYLAAYAGTLLPRIRTAVAEGGWPGIFP